MSKFNFLTKYAIDGRHYNSQIEIDKALDDSDWVIRNNAIKHPNVTKEHIDKALNDVDWEIRLKAIQHPNATKEQIDKALNHPANKHVENSAQERLKETQK